MRGLLRRGGGDGGVGRGLRADRADRPRVSVYVFVPPSPAPSTR